MPALRIWNKLFIATGVIVMLALAAMLVLIQQSFSRGFSDYLTRWEAVEIDNLEARLISAYEEYGDWRFLELRGPEMQRLLGVLIGPAPDSAGPPRDRRRPGTGPRPGGDRREQGRPPPPRAGEDRPVLLRRNGGKRGDRPPGPSLLDSGSRIAIADAGGAQIAGPREVFNDGQRRELKSGEEVIGFLIVLPAPLIERDLDSQFAGRQARNVALIGLAILALAAPLIVVVARRLMAPLGQLASATHDLAGGDYAHRVKIDSGDELQQLGDDFNRMAEALQKQRDSQRRWLAEISHELRTPLSVLTGEIEALKDGVRDTTPEALASLETETHQLTRLVEDLYFLSVSDAGGTRYQRYCIDLTALLRGSLTSKSTEDLSLNLRLPEEAWIEGDADRINQVFANLLNNSQRYTDLPGSIEVSMTPDDQAWVIRWEDSSPCPNEEDIGMLFDPLYRAERSRDRRFGGAGLGLAIVRSIVDAHGGSASASASELGGVNIEIRLPAIAHPGDGA